MSVGIHVKHGMESSHIEKQCRKNWHDGGGLGFNPKFAGKPIEGVGIDRVKYEKGFSRMTGACKKCKYYKGDNSPVNQHCKAKRCVK